jgi:hypothetical protein
MTFNRPLRLSEAPMGMRVKLRPFHPKIRRNPESTLRIRGPEFMFQHAYALAETKIG